LSLLEEHVLELTGVCIQNARSFNTKLLNDLDAGGAEFRVAVVRRSRRGSLGL
jgi:hypothetical protein